MKGLIATFVHRLSIGSVGSGCVTDVAFRNVTISGQVHSLHSVIHFHYTLNMKIVMTYCLFSDQQAACRVKTYSTTTDGYVRNISWTDIHITDTDKCITVDTDYHPVRNPRNCYATSTCAFYLLLNCKVLGWSGPFAWRAIYKRVGFGVSKHHR